MPINSCCATVHASQLVQKGQPQPTAFPQSTQNCTISTTNGLVLEILRLMSPANSNRSVHEWWGREVYPDDVTTAGISREAGAACFSLLSVALPGKHSQFCFDSSQRTAAPLPGPDRDVIPNLSFRRAFTLCKGLEEQKVAYLVIHLDLELLNTDLNG